MRLPKSFSEKLKILRLGKPFWVLSFLFFLSFIFLEEKSFQKINHHFFYLPIFLFKKSPKKSSTIRIGKGDSLKSSHRPGRKSLFKKRFLNNFFFENFFVNFFFWNGFLLEKFSLVRFLQKMEQLMFFSSFWTKKIVNLSRERRFWPKTTRNRVLEVDGGNGECFLIAWQSKARMGIFAIDNKHIWLTD